MSLTIGVVIPCYKPHIVFLKRLFDSIENQTKKPDMVIVSCSSSEQSDIPYKQEDYSFPFKIYTHKEKKLTAQNKNFGAKKISTDIISFFDADDIMHPQRLEIIYNSFIKYTTLRLLIHNFRINSTDFNYPEYDINNINLEFDPFYVCRWGSVQLKENSHRNIHNGHISIRNETFKEQEFSESDNTVGYEDTLYNRILINKYPSNNFIAYYTNELSWYYPSGTGGIDRS
jgi:glycosyltransferase involved in cell wall biosynthesis